MLFLNSYPQKRFGFSVLHSVFVDGLSTDFCLFFGRLTGNRLFLKIPPSYPRRFYPLFYESIGGQPRFIHILGG